MRLVARGKRNTRQSPCCTPSSSSLVAFRPIFYDLLSSEKYLPVLSYTRLIRASVGFFVRTTVNRWQEIPFKIEQGTR